MTATILFAYQSSWPGQFWQVGYWLPEAGVMAIGAHVALSEQQARIAAAKELRMRGFNVMDS